MIRNCIDLCATMGNGSASVGLVPQMNGKVKCSNSLVKRRIAKAEISIVRQAKALMRIVRQGNSGEKQRDSAVGWITVVNGKGKEQNCRVFRKSMTRKGIAKKT